MNDINVESKLKEIINERYGSLKAFSEAVEMPWSTVNSILTRGILNSNINNVLRITNELNLNVAALLCGEFVPLASSNDSNDTAVILQDLLYRLHSEEELTFKGIKLVEQDRELLIHEIDNAIGIMNIKLFS